MNSNYSVPWHAVETNKQTNKEKMERPKVSSKEKHVLSEIELVTTAAACAVVFLLFLCQVTIGNDIHMNKKVCNFLCFLFGSLVC